MVLLPFILLALIPIGAVMLSYLLAALTIGLISKRLRLAKRAKKEFLSKRAMPVDRKIEVYGSARSKRDLNSWDFVYQKNRWIAENQDLIASAASAHRDNLELHGRVTGELSALLETTHSLPFPLKRLEGRRVKKALSKMSWAQNLELHCLANYTSPAGRVNLNDSQIYHYEFQESALGSTLASSKLPLIFDDPSSLQFPGVYVYSYPHFMEGRETFPLKIGKSESSVHARVRQQIAQGGAAIPEDPIIICAIRLDQGAGIAESLLHASFRERRTSGGGTEWFTISLKELRNELTARNYSSTWNKELGNERYQSSLRKNSQA